MRRLMAVFALFAAVATPVISAAERGGLLSPLARAALVSPYLRAADDATETARKRKHQVDQILTSARPEIVADQRWICLNGQQPSEVRQARSEGLDFIPDAFDSCLAALQRKGKDRALPEAYKKLVINLEGNPDTSENLPRAIGAAVLSGDGKVSLGNGKGIKVDAALALDAGFTVAYMRGAAKKEGLDQQKLKLVGEDCLDQKKDAGTCFSLGYALGAQAVNAQ